MRLRHRLVVLSVVAVAFALGDVLAVAEELQPQLERRVVAKSFDGKPFVYEFWLISETPEYRVYGIRYPSPVESDIASNNTVPGELFLPREVCPSAPIPAVICLHILSGERNLMELTCAALASRGVAAFMFRLPFYGERGEGSGPRIVLERPDLFVQAIEQAWADARRAVDILAYLPEVDPERVSVFGISLGGIVAFGVAGNEPRIWRVLAVLAGGNLPLILEHARETRTLREALAQWPAEEKERVLRCVHRVDPITQASRLREKAAAGRIYMINATDDEVVPRVCTEELIAALGPGVRVTWLEGVGHYSAISKLPQVVEETVAFFAQDLPTGQASPRRNPSPQVAPEVILGRFLLDLSKLVGGDLSADKAHHVALRGWAGRKDGAGRQIHFSLDFARAGTGRFRLAGELPQIGQIVLGQDQAPWILARNGTLFVGSCGLTGDSAENQTAGEKASGVQSPVDREANRSAADSAEASQACCPADPLRFAEPQYLDQLRMASGLLAAGAYAPQLLAKQGISVDKSDEADGPMLLLKSQALGPAEVKLYFLQDQKTPRKLEFTVGEWTGSVDIATWRIEEALPADHFAIPESSQRQEVPCYEVHRVFGAVFNFLASSLTGR